MLGDVKWVQTATEDMRQIKYPLDRSTVVVADVLYTMVTGTFRHFLEASLAFKMEKSKTRKVPLTCPSKGILWVIIRHLKHLHKSIHYEAKSLNYVKKA